MSKAVKLINARNDFRRQFPEINSGEWDLLDEILVRQSFMKQTIITDAMQFDLASPASIHRYLSNLRKHELLDVDMKDGRTKPLVLGVNGKKYLAKLEKVLNT